MKYIVLFFLLLSSSKMMSQEYFNKRFDPFNSICDYSWNIYSDSVRTIVTYATCTGAGISGYSAASIMELDSSGNILEINNYLDSVNAWYFGGGGSLTKVNNGFILGGTKDTLNSQAFLLRLNDSADTIWTKTFGDTNFQSGWSAKQCTDGGFFLCGQSNTYGSIIKTDSSGNFIWQTLLGGINKRVLFYSIAPTFDRGCAAVGRWRDISGNFDIYIAKLDSAGNLEWDSLFNTIPDDEGWSIAATKDSNIVIAGFYSSSQNYFTWPFLAKFDYQGNVLWLKQYGDSLFYTGFYSIRELNDGSFIACGQFDPLVPFSVEYGLIYKISSNGDSVWSNYYYSGINSRNYLRDIYPTNDGGYIAFGDLLPFAPDTGSQDLWLLKIDSRGCEMANCFISVNEMSVKSEMKIYPNPCSKELTIVSNQNEIVLAKIYDVYGKLIKDVNCDKVYELTVNVTDLVDGMYVLSIFDSKGDWHSFRIIHIK
jgi:hypothetical protein